MSASRIADQRHLGQVEPLAQQVDADEHVVLAEPQLADDLDPLERVDLRVQVADPEPHLEQVVGQVLGHLLGQRRHERALVAVDAPADLVHQVVDLVAGLAHLDLGVDDPGRADDLLDDPRRVACARTRPASPTRTRAGASSTGTPGTSAAGCRARSGAGSRSRRASACASGRPRTCRRSAARSGATRRRSTTKSAGEVVEQAVRPLARLAAVEDPRVVLDPVAEPELPQHLHVVLGALAQPVGLEQLALRLELRAPLVQLAPISATASSIIPSRTL